MQIPKSNHLGSKPLGTILLFQRCFQLFPFLTYNLSKMTEFICNFLPQFCKYSIFNRLICKIPVYVSNKFAKKCGSLWTQAKVVENIAKYSWNCSMWFHYLSKQISKDHFSKIPPYISIHHFHQAINKLFSMLFLSLNVFSDIKVISKDMVGNHTNCLVPIVSTIRNISCCFCLETLSIF